MTPTLTSGNAYFYKTGTTVAIPLVEDVISTSTGYTSWDGTADITATTGNEIVIVETNGGLAVQSGKATVTSKA